MELLTGLSEKRVAGCTLTPELFGLTDGIGVPLKENENPFLHCIESKIPKSGIYKLSGRSGRELKVEMKIVPVQSAGDQASGAVVFLHDASSQLDLQRQLKDLYEFSMLDPLTQVANRAEFERSLDQFVRTRMDADFECSLIICDIDFFKQINDNYNHHVGDQALVAFASLLKQFVRAQDVVARYGGEEFVILCANCDRDAAVQRAEEIRKTLRGTAQPMLDGKYITASFGVSQLQAGESATEFFVRADTALLSAKENGRNRVVAAENSLANVEDDSEPTTEPDQILETTDDRLAWRSENSATPLSTNLYRSAHRFRYWLKSCVATLSKPKPRFGTSIPTTPAFKSRSKTRTTTHEKGGLRSRLNSRNLMMTMSLAGENTPTFKSTFVRVKNAGFQPTRLTSHPWSCWNYEDTSP